VVQTHEKISEKKWRQGCKQHDKARDLVGVLDEVERQSLGEVQNGHEKRAELEHQLPTFVALCQAKKRTSQREAKGERRGGEKEDRKDRKDRNDSPISFSRRL
jgi:hypothetical protein